MMPTWKKMLIVGSAVFYSLVCGISKFITGAHTIDQIVLGWLLGAWIAITYFVIFRKIVHKHVLDLMQGRTTSSSKMFFIISTVIFVVAMIVMTVTLLVVKDKGFKWDSSYEKPGDVSSIAEYDIWHTWAKSAIISASLGGYWGMLHQNRRFGGQLFIQQKFDQLKGKKITRFILRFLISFVMCILAIIVTIILYTEEPCGGQWSSGCIEAKTSQTLFFFAMLVAYLITGFILFAYLDSVCLWAGLYDRAPTGDNIVFNEEDDKLLLQGGTSRIMDMSASNY